MSGKLDTRIPRHALVEGVTVVRLAKQRLSRDDEVPPHIGQVPEHIKNKLLTLPGREASDEGDAHDVSSRLQRRDRHAALVER